MQALILAAGMGRRLLPYTAVDTKCMVPVHGVPLIDRMLDALSEVPVSRILMVLGHGAQRVRDHVGERWNGIPVTYLINVDYTSTNNIYSLWLAAPHLEDEDLLLLESDLIFEPEIILQLVADPRPDVAVVDTTREWMSGTVLALDDDGNVQAFGNSRDRSCRDYLKTVNTYKVSARFMREWFMPHLDRHIEQIGRTQYYEEVLWRIVELGGTHLAGLRVHGRRWYEIDTPEDLSAAEQLFPAEQSHYQRMMSRYGGYWRFPDLVDHCYLVNPFFPPPELRAELADQLPALLCEYPSGQAVLAELAGRLFGVDPSHIVVGNGASELIRALASTMAGQRVAVSVPTFEEYRRCFPGAEVVPLHTPLERATERFDVLLNANSDAVVVINPDNPSGSYLDREAVVHFLCRMQEASRTVILDESFTDFSIEGERGRLLTQDVLDSFPNLVVVRSLGKSHGVAGLRSGVLATSCDRVVESVRTNLPVWNVNAMAEQFLAAAPKYEREYWMACSDVARERAVLRGMLKETGLGDVLESGANFVTFVLDRPVSSSLVAARLLRKGFLVKDLSAKPGVSCDALRFAVRSGEENRRLVAAVEESVHECST